MKADRQLVRLIAAALFLVTWTAARVASAQERAAMSDEPPVVSVGLDAYRQWERWPYQRLG